MRKLLMNVLAFLHVDKRSAALMGVAPPAGANPSCSPTRMVGALLLGLACVSCSDPLYRWKEEVQLPDGAVLVVERTIRFRDYTPIGGSGGGADVTASTLELLTPMENAPPLWSAPPLLPMLLDRDPVTGEWFIVSTFFMCSVWYDLGKPALPYVEYRLRNGKWMRAPLSQQLIGRDANVLVPAEADVKSDQSLETKRLLGESRAIGRKYRQIIADWQTNC